MYESQHQVPFCSLAFSIVILNDVTNVIMIAIVLSVDMLNVMMLSIVA